MEKHPGNSISLDRVFVFRLFKEEKKENIIRTTTTHQEME